MNEHAKKTWTKVWPILLVILTPFLLIARMCIAGYYILYARLILDVIVSSHSKCPSCGTRQEHKIQFSRGYNKVIHQCPRCSAEWGEDPVLPVERWQIVQVPEVDKNLGIKGSFSL